MSTAAARPMSEPMDENALVRQHTDLVKRIAHHLAARLPASVEVDDLIQAGVIGLIEAARNYSGTRGASFETYAGIRIRGAMLDELRQTDWAPRSVHRRERAVQEAIRKIEQETGREAREHEVAERLDIGLPEYHSIVQDAARCQVLSLDHSGENNDETIDAPDDTAGPLQCLQHAEFQQELTQAITELPERERLVLSMYYERELNLREIGAVLKVSESRVCQIHGQALLRLRARLKSWHELAAI
ncbi:RNA polymerase sigma factor FliA [Solimonas marina]|uniref:RNA polymerase sigma factor FliA n=1 Tax=Solimonas marina TaxID=2714601 RepID=A0A969W6W9_9GAMM|nr:RNA polymerase sigma factor FliA [Solimonas marina]NKF21707.1 RNA polymerase sigma factor FliA [Solimonas marina]